MPRVQNVSVKDGDVIVLVGTMKGAFVFRSNPARKRWARGGPYFAGHAVYALAYDGRAGRRRLWAGASSMHWGSVLHSSDDFGRTWTEPAAANVKFPEDTGAALRNIWQIKPGPADRPGTLWAGVEPAALFESNDAGATWSLVRGLYDHPHRPRWEPGGGGLCLHTIVPDAQDPHRMFIAISTGGVYRTDDGGRTWAAKNKGVRADFLPDKHPEFGQCVHKIAQNPKRPERLYLQNHWGLYRSDDSGDSWQDMAKGVPSDFGFPIVAHPHDPEVAYIVPLESDGFRVVPEGKLRVYRTRDGGKSWEPLRKGLPQKDAYETILRDGLAVDTLDPAGVYFGTRSGRLYGSSNGGAAWTQLAEGLPPVVCVKTAVIGEPKPARRAKARGASPRREAEEIARVSVRFLLPSYLRPFAGGAARLEFDGRPATVGAALAVLGERHPGVRDRVLSEDGRVRPHVNVFVGDESIRYSGGLATPLDEGAEISIVPAVSGGAPARPGARLLAAALTLAALASGLSGAGAAGNADLPHPRLGLYGRALGTGWPLVKADGTFDATVLDQIARYHVVVLSATPFTEYYPDALYQIRLRHLGLPLYAYVQPDYVVPASQPDSLVNLPTRQWILVRNLGGFLYDKGGGSFGDANVNLAKRANGRYVVAEALADFYQQAILSTGRWDGLFLDRFCTSIVWQQSAGDSVDYVRAGYPDLASFDTAWRAASDTLANRLRRIVGTAPVLIGNCAQSVQYAAMNGWAHENFPFQNGGTWDQNLFRSPGGYMVEEASFRAPQSNWLISWPTDLAHPFAPDQARRARFGLGTASLGDGFGTFNPSDIDPRTGYMSWWYDEYAVDLSTGRSSTLGANTGWLGKALAPYTVIPSIGPDDPASANPGFETDVSGWTLATTVSATLARDATTAAVGVASGKVVVPAAGANASSTRLTTAGYVTFWAGPPWTVSFWARAAASRAIRASLVDVINGTEYAGSNVTLDGTWRRFTLSFTAPASSPLVRLSFQLGGAAVNVWLDDVHCTRTGINLYRRDFERGTVLVNPTGTGLPVLLEQPFRRILGTIDPVTNDGSGGTQFTVPGGDALFLIRTSSLVGVAPEPGARSTLAWASAGPNPAAPGSVVLARLAVPAAGRLTAAVYDARGRRVRLLFDGAAEPGMRALEWDGRDEHGQSAPPGLYFLRAAQGDAVATRKLVRA